MIDGRKPTCQVGHRSVKPLRSQLREARRRNVEKCWQGCCVIQGCAKKWHWHGGEGKILDDHSIPTIIRSVHYVVVSFFVCKGVMRTYMFVEKTHEHMHHQLNKEYSFRNLCQPRQCYKLMCASDICFDAHVPEYIEEVDLRTQVQMKAKVGRNSCIQGILLHVHMDI